MPPISPQGSRTGLVTALVIFVILFVTSTILFIYENAERRNLQDHARELETRQADLASDTTMTAPEVTALMESARAANPPSTALDTVLTQRRSMAKAITGHELPPDKVIAAVEAARARATAKDIADANIRVARTNGLAEIVMTMSTGVADLQRRMADMQSQLNAAKAETTQVIASRDQLLKEKDKQIEEIRNQAQQEAAQTVAYRTKNLGTVQTIEKNTTAALTQQQESNAQLSSQLNQANATIQKRDLTIDELTRRLKGLRVGVNEPTIQKADGEIVRVPDTTTAIINLGEGDHIVQGMTFEVYDRQTGVPALGDGLRAGEMPEGKASLEVIRMAPGYSECRVIRRKPGYGLAIGDIIANLVYDSTQKYNFVVYGDFDLNGDGRAQSGDADVLKQLVTRWGGKLVNEVNVETDFIIMGMEPKAEPALATDDALVRQQKLEAQQALDRYMQVLKQASTLNIPIMNQNRFLNFVGYRALVTR